MVRPEIDEETLARLRRWANEEIYTYRRAEEIGNRGKYHSISKVINQLLDAYYEKRKIIKELREEREKPQ